MDAKTYREKDEKIPFQEDVNVNLFFPGAQRRELVDDVLAALREGVTFLSISGEEGTGKTMICRMVEKEIADNYMCVYIPDNLESFDDVIAAVSKAVGFDGRESQKEAAGQEEQALRLFLREKKQRLVVIFDNAEKMYLAMLERLRKQLDRMNREETLLQMILAGRRLLYENLEQLEICEFEEIEEVHFHLSALEQSETHAYLNHCAKLRSREMGKCMFSSEAAKKIFSLGKGNLKVTNKLASKAIASADAEDSFVVRPKNVIIGDESTLPGKDRFQLLNLFSTTAKRNWIITGAGIVALTAILFIFMRGEGEQDEKTVLSEQQNQAMPATAGRDEAADPGVMNSSRLEIQGKSVDQDENIVSKEEDSLFVVTTAKEDAEVKQAEKTLAEATMAEEKEAEQSQPLVGNDSDQSENQQVNRNGVSADSPADKDSAMDYVTDEPKSKASSTAADETGRKDMAGMVGKQPDNQSEGQISQTENSAVKKTAGQVVVSQLKVEERKDNAIADAGRHQQKQEVYQQETVDQEDERQQKEVNGGIGNTTAEDDSPVLRETSKNTPIRMANIAEPKQIHQIAPVKFSSQSTGQSSKTRGSRAVDIPAEILYQQRVLAGRQLLSKEQGNYQTIQLMALSAGKAEENLQNRLTRKQYRAIAENLYIVKSMDNSMVFVYYGQFPDEAAAQQARKKLPEFLRKNSPYVISLEDARRKTNFHQ